MGSTRSKSRFHKLGERWMAMATTIAVACCLMFSASCTSSPPEIAKQQPVQTDQMKDPLMQPVIGGESAPVNGVSNSNGPVLPQGGNATSTPVNSSNPSNSIRFVPNDIPFPGGNINNSVIGSQLDPAATATPPAMPLGTYSAAGCTQPIPTTLPVGGPPASHQTSWTETTTSNRPEELKAQDIPAPLGEMPSNETDAEQSVSSVLQYAMAHHPALRVRQHEIEAARARLITARLLPNPEFMIQTASPTNTDDPTQLSTRLMFTVPIGPKRAWRTAVAQTGIYEAQMALSQETRLILTEAADAAIEVLYLQEQDRLNAELAKFSNQIAAIQKERFKIAATNYRDVVRSELAAYNAELARRNAAALLNQSKVRLARAMGIPEGSPPPMEGSLKASPLFFPPLSNVLNRAGRTSPELAKTCGAIQESQQQHALERWNAIPDVSIGPRVINDVSGEPKDQVGGRVQFDVPLFDRNQGNIAETAADIKTNSATYDMIRVTTLNDVAALYMELQDVQSRVEYAKKSLHPLAEQTQRALREAFEDRTVSAYELTDLLQSLSQMKLSDLELRHSHHRLRMRLELLLECPISSLGGSEIPPLPPEAVSIPTPPDAPVESAKP